MRSGLARSRIARMRLSGIKTGVLLLQYGIAGALKYLPPKGWCG